MKQNKVYPNDCQTILTLSLIHTPTTSHFNPFIVNASPLYCLPSYEYLNTPIRTGSMRQISPIYYLSTWLPHFQQRVNFVLV